MARKRSRERLGLEDHRAALTQAVKSMPQVLLVVGAETYLRRQALTSFLQALREEVDGLDEISLHGPATASEAGLKLGAVVGELASDSLFASQKVLLVQNAEHVLFPRRGSSAEEDSKPCSSKRRSPEDQLIAFAKEPPTGVWLVLVCEKLNRQRTLGKKLHEHAHLIPCPELTHGREITRWLEETAKGMDKSLAPGGADALLTAHGGHLGTLHAELIKFSTYVGERSRIGLDDAEAFLSGSIEFDVFALTNAIEARDSGRALVYARRVAEQGLRDMKGKKSDGQSSSHRAMAMVASTMQGILQARVVMGEGGKSREVAQAAKTSPWRAERLMKAAENFSLAQLRRIIRRLAQVMHSTHDTGADVCLSLERAVLVCCGPDKG